MNQIIGIFGGTFDPPTWAHYQVAQAALDSGKVSNDFSSTKLREAIKNNGVEAPLMTRSTVLDYIMMNGLYR